MDIGKREARARELFAEHFQKILLQTDRVFAALLVVQWLFGIFVAIVLSPYTWEGRIASVHVHVYAAIFLGGALSSLPIALIKLRPGEAVTRHVVAIAQMLWSA